MFRVALVTYGMLGGGIETFLLNLGKSLQAQGCDVTVVTTEVPGAWFPRIEQMGLKSYHITGLGTNSPLHHVVRVAEVLYSGRFDGVVINHDRFAQAAIGIGKVLPVVIPVLHLNNDFFAGLTLFNSHLCSAIVTVSPAGQKIVNKLKADCQVKVILNGVAVGRTDEAVVRNFNQNELKLIYVGRIYDKDKGVFQLPEILAQLIDEGVPVKLDIVGDGSDRPELDARFKTACLEDYVHFWGNLTVERVYDLLRRAHVLLFITPTVRTEGLPLVLLEALMAGCIPVSNLLEGSTDYIIKNGKTGFLVSAGDIRQFVECIRGLYHNRELMQKMSKNAQEYAKDNVSFDVMGDKYFDLLMHASNMGKSRRVRPLASTDEIKNYLSRSPVAKVSNYYRKWLDCFDKNQLITLGYKQKKVAIFGSLRTALYLLHDLNVAGAEVVSFLDNNQELHGQYLYGIPIVGLGWLADNHNLIDAVILSIENEDDEKIKQTLQKRIPSIKIVSWKSLVEDSGVEL